MKLLFVSWDGPGPNYLESLFLPILSRLREDGDEVHVLQFAWGSGERTESVRAAARGVEIRYTSRPVALVPKLPATLAMVGWGAVDIAAYVRRHDIDVLMPRSTIPAAMSLGAMRLSPSPTLIYDADGLMADERVEFGGAILGSRSDRALRTIDAAAVRAADVVLTRTLKARAILSERAGLDSPAKIFVVGNGKDESVFRPATANERRSVRHELGIDTGAPLLVYAGSLGTQYHPVEMVRLASLIAERRPGAQLLILTASVDVARSAIREGQLDPSAARVMRVSPDAVARYLGAADLGIALRTPSLSQRAVAPIKVGEYLLCGLPVVCTAGVGDLDTQMDSSCGLVLQSVATSELRRAAGWFVDEVLPHRDRYRSTCRERGTRDFSLDATVRRYRSALARPRRGQ